MRNSAFYRYNGSREGRAPRLSEAERQANAKHLADSQKGKALFESRKSTPLDDRFKQEAWGDRNFYEVTVPEGMDVHEYKRLLTLGKRFTYPTFSIEDGKLIEEFFYSIGD